MRYRDLVEAPIDQYAAVGNWDDPSGSFRSSNRADIEKSHKIIQSPAAVNKIRLAWAKIPQKFNFWMLNAPEPTKSSNVAVYDIADFEKDHRFDPYRDQIKPSSDAINVIFTTNLTSVSNYKPMTAWIMAHRLMHSIQFGLGKRFKDQYAIYSKIERDMAALLVKTMQAYGYDTTASKNDLPVISWNAKAGNSLISKLFTMRSARSGKIENQGDAAAELMAQHMLTGRISFNELPSNLSHPKSYRGDAPIVHSRPINPAVAADLNARWQSLGKRLDRQFEQLLDSLIGKVLVL
jgi:hypothetical protein